MTGSSLLSPGIACLPVQKITADYRLDTHDPVVVEEPLEIVLEHGPAAARIEQTVFVTMRTPGQDLELALGFLFTKGLLPERAALLHPHGMPSDEGTPPADISSIRIALHPLVTIGHTSGPIATHPATSIRHNTHRQELPPINAGRLYHLPALLREGQDLFDFTGGQHAAGLFDHHGHLLDVREDIGRHNALDKLIGSALLNDQLPLCRHILLLSGRASFELIQKAVTAGFSIIAAVGPPSSMAVQLARESGITLIGFLRDQRFTIYSGANRILL